MGISRSTWNLESVLRIMKLWPLQRLGCMGGKTGSSTFQGFDDSDVIKSEVIVLTVLLC